MTRRFAGDGESVENPTKAVERGFPLLLFTDTDGRHTDTAAWQGDWPPPDSLWIAVGRTSGLIAYVEPARCQSIDLLALTGTAYVTRYRLGSFSDLPADGLVARGARYVEVPE